MANIYSAPSLSEVIRHLMIYRLTGVLTIRRAAGPRREEASLAIVQGRPVRVRWGTYEDNANESVLRWMNGWGEIHFMFHVKETQRLLPPPRQEQSIFQNPQYPSHYSSPSSVTRPIPQVKINASSVPMTGPTVREENRQAQRIHEDASSYSIPSQSTVKQLREEPQNRREMPGTTPLTNIPLLTENARHFPLNDLARYDRTIFLLINNRRTIGDLVQLTRRSLTEVYGSLFRLRDLQLIEFWS
jgi:hypothetical protein